MSTHVPPTEPGKRTDLQPVGRDPQVELTRVGAWVRDTGPIVLIWAASLALAFLGVHSLAMRAGWGRWWALLLPIALDVAAGWLAWASSRCEFRSQHWWVGTVTMGVLMVASVAANVADAVVAGPLHPRIVAAVHGTPPVLAVVFLEVALHVRKGWAADTADTADADMSADTPDTARTPVSGHAADMSADNPDTDVPDNPDTPTEPPVRLVPDSWDTLADAVRAAVSAVGDDTDLVLDWLSAHGVPDANRDTVRKTVRRVA